MVDTTIVEYHLKGITVFVIYYVASSIANDRSRLTLSLGCVHLTVGRVVLVLSFVEEVAVVVVVVSIHTFVAETIDTSKCVTNLYALHQVARTANVAVVIVIVLVGQYGSVHRGYGIDVLCDVGTELYGEFTYLENIAGIDIEFPTLIFHCTYVSPVKATETSGGRNADTAVEEVGYLLLIYVEVEGNKVVEQTEVNTNVPFFRALPLNSRESEVVGYDGLSTIVRTIGTILIIYKAFGEVSTTVSTPTRTEGQHAYDLLEGLKELLIADVPTCGNTGEEAPFVTATELGATIGTKSGIKRVLGTDRIVERTSSAHGVALTSRSRSSSQITGSSRRSNTAADTRRGVVLIARRVGSYVQTGQNLE